jgi:hypothetical protein
MNTVRTTPDRARDGIDGRSLHDATAREPDAARGWIAIAMRSRKCTKEGTRHWQPVPGAPVSVQEARHLADAGTLLLASRYQPDRVELVVQLSAATRRDVGAMPVQP